MRTIAVALLALTVLPLAVPAHASDSLNQSLDYLIQNANLEPKRQEAHAKCVKDVPQVAELLNRPLVSKFCIVRFGAPRAHALFLGEQISKWFDDHKEAEVSNVVDQLLTSLESRR